jgi:hypothetical protein
MAIISEKNQGIRLPLASAVPTPLHLSREVGGYYKVRSYHGGGEFFQSENAQVILQSLGEFLPRATERLGSDGRLEIFYQHLINGHDVCGSTASIDTGVNIPKTEITRLQEAISRLKAKENDPTTDPTKREIIRAFRLPSPEKDPELYRLYGRGSNARLLVLWGVEKEAGSSLAPQDALLRVPQTKGSIPWWSWVLLALLLLLLLLAWWWRTQQPTGKTASYSLGSSSPAHIIEGNPSPDGRKSPKGTSSAPSDTKGVGIAPHPSDPKEGATKSDPSSPRTSLGDQIPSSEPAKGTMPPGTGPETPPGTAKSDPSAPPPPGGSPWPPNTITSRRSTTLPDDPKQQTKSGDMPKGDDSTKTSQNGEPIPSADMPSKGKEDAKEKVSGDMPPLSPPLPIDPLKPVQTGEPKTSADMPPKGKDDTEVKKAEPAKPGDFPPPSEPAASKTGKPPNPAKEALPLTQTVPKAAPISAAPKSTPLSAEIVNARTSAEPKDGKVEMQLSILARDAEGKAITIAKVESWSVDGKTQNDESGHPINTNGLPVNLTEGIHSVRVTGTTADGRPVTAEAEVNVDIAVREESIVRVKQVGKP